MGAGGIEIGKAEAPEHTKVIIGWRAAGKEEEGRVGGNGTRGSPVE